MKEIKHLKEVVPILDIAFRYEFVTYVKDFHVKTFFEKTFGIRIIQAYVSGSSQLVPKKNELRWDARTIVLFLLDGKIVQMSNSEWADIAVRNKKQPPVLSKQLVHVLDRNLAVHRLLCVNPLEKISNPPIYKLVPKTNCAIGFDGWPSKEELSTGKFVPEIHLIVSEPEFFQLQFIGVIWAGGPPPVLSPHHSSIFRFYLHEKGYVVGELLVNGLNEY